MAIWAAGEPGSIAATGQNDIRTGVRLHLTYTFEARTRQLLSWLPPIPCIANGLVMRAVRDVMILAPPLVITAAEIDHIVVKARLALDLTLRDLRAD